MNLLFQDHILKCHDFFITQVLIQDFSGPKNQKTNFGPFFRNRGNPDILQTWEDNCWHGGN